MNRPPVRLYSPPQGEPKLPRAAKRATGVYYTPPEVVRDIVALTLAPLLKSSTATLRILDPACGAGGMLTEAGRFGVSLYGVDCDPAAVEVARQAAGNAEIWCGDALFDQRLEELAPFDAIVANPPYVNIRELMKGQGPEYVQRLRGRFRTARGSFDLYVAFIERALELLREGGRCGMIVPNKWQTLDYAEPCRRLLRQEANLERVIDLSSERVFCQAAVYPHVLIFQKVRPTSQVVPLRAASLGIDVESRVPTVPLDQVTHIHCGTAGFSARRIADRLLDEGDWHYDSAPQAVDFITSGNIDRYQVRLGNVRYLKRTYVRPRLPLVSPELTPARQRLFAGPKIVIAGLSRRIEAAWDDRGLALGVQVFAAADCGVDPHYLLALLNSKLLSYLFRTRFAAKRLAGGYLAINKGQLVQLPITQSSPLTPSGPAVETVLKLAELAQRQTTTPSPATDAEIDRRVYQLYRLTDAEIAQVENHFAELTVRAA